jgi:hypothetical protein
LANKKAYARLRPIIHDYLMDLAKLGAYGKDKSGVVRHLLENGIAHALETQVIAKRDVRDYGETISETLDFEDEEE